MKVNKMLVIGIITSMVIILMPTISKAGVEIKPGGTLWINISISDAYAVCYEMREKTSTLGNNTLDPHLALHKDWGACAYLALSSYGAVKDNKGPNSTPQVNGVDYTSTTGNPTGVMDFGKTRTYVSAGRETSLASADHPEYRQNLIDNINTKYVEKLPDSYIVENTRGMALAETAEWFGALYQTATSSYPLVYRFGVLGGQIRYGNNWNRLGGADPVLTFRPVIWN